MIKAFEKYSECPKGQHWDECGSPCEDTCENPAGSTVNIIMTINSMRNHYE